ncbi:hypothetical protein ABZ016_13110 [Streptomyces sp. NPDC006372]|uniref:hypothetical protein n=1 Tax=Streptomyces sp. NPDC006372 TaxID=3155599 RepID=UPI0033A905A1
MDAGLAAVLAGVTGFAGAVIGSALQCRATVHAARRQSEGDIQAAVEGAAKAGEEAARQVALQTLNGRADWLRQHRVDASLAMLTASNDFAAAGSALRNELDRRRHENLRALAAELRATDSRVVHAYFQVRIFGPDALKETAANLREQINEPTDALLAPVVALATGGTVTSRAEEHADEQVAIAAARHSEFVAAVSRVVADLEF